MNIFILVSGNSNTGNTYKKRCNINLDLRDEGGLELQTSELDVEHVYRTRVFRRLDAIISSIFLKIFYLIFYSNIVL